MKRKSKEKSRAGKFFFYLILMGFVLSMLFLYDRGLFHPLSLWLEKGGIRRETKEVVLYFSDHEGGYLIGEKRAILKRDEVEEEAKEIVIELIKGPKGKRISTLPSQTKLLAFQLGGRGVAQINFDQAFLRDHPGGSSAEMMTVYAIVNSLTFNFPQIKQVQFLVEGKAIETIAGHLSLKQPVPSRPDLIKKTGKNKGKD